MNLQGRLKIKNFKQSLRKSLKNNSPPPQYFVPGVYIFFFKTINQVMCGSNIFLPIFKINNPRTNNYLRMLKLKEYKNLNQVNCKFYLLFLLISCLSMVKCPEERIYLFKLLVIFTTRSSIYLSYYSTTHNFRNQVRIPQKR